MVKPRIIARHDSTLDGAFRPQRLPLPVLVRAVSARAHPEQLSLREGRCVVGAGAEADLVIKDDTVSRRHATLELVPEGVAVSDLQSKNGSYYLGQRFERMTLHPGSRFRVGSAEIELSLDHDSLRLEQHPDLERYGDVIGVSAEMKQLFGTLQRLEGSKVSVLICGESGTGKELIARALHEHSVVRSGPLVTVNCGALDRNLARSELFGHQRGAFTGAVQQQRGAFEAAHGGTLFLDEIGELPLEVQPLLLRAVELGRIVAVGSHEERPIDVRLVAATHRDLAAEVAAGRFRQDLFYRIRVVSLEVPPLRVRPADIPVLARSIAQRRGATLPEGVVQALERHHWPGNVRELVNAVEAYLAVGHTPAPETAPAHTLQGVLSPFIDSSRPYADQKEEVLREFTRAYLGALLRDTAGNQSEAARISGLDRSYLGRLVAKLGLGPRSGEGTP